MTFSVSILIRQEDSNNNMVGDACDSTNDRDNDGVPDEVLVADLSNSSFGLPNEIAHILFNLLPQG